MINKQVVIEIRRKAWKATLPHDVRIYPQDIVPPAGQRSRDFHKSRARSGEVGIAERTKMFVYKYDSYKYNSIVHKQFYVR
jgi:hypothetical protein